MSEIKMTNRLTS